jgi:hypothetical protein
MEPSLMSTLLISRSPDLLRLRNEGYVIEVLNGFLLVRDIPFVDANRQVGFGTLVSSLAVIEEKAMFNGDHVARFSGVTPCHQDGQPMHKLIISSGHEDLADGVEVDHTFSRKPTSGMYADYYEKMTTYINLLSGPANAIDPSVTAKTFRVIEDIDVPSVFNYYDTSSSRAGISELSDRLNSIRIAIIGLGGTGSYILDLVCKTPVLEIHLFDGDLFELNNAFRAPGAPSAEDLKAQHLKVKYFQNQYCRMHRNIYAHEEYVDGGNVESLRNMDFVFLSLDRGSARKLLILKLEEFDIPFLDVGVGLQVIDGFVTGHVRVTTSTDSSREKVRGKFPIGSDPADDLYSANIQIAEMNALNAALAVIRWKKFFGFYSDLEHENHSIYTIDGNSLDNGKFE